METKDITKQLQGLLEKLQQRKEELAAKCNAKGYVVAGYGGETYYAFIGEGKGFQGAALSPMSHNPVIFDTIEAARKEVYNGTYRNGADEVIKLKVIGASHHFRTVYGMLQKNIEMIKAEFNK